MLFDTGRFKDIVLAYDRECNLNCLYCRDEKYKNSKEITKAFFKEASTLDYVGIYKGKYIEFDAKQTLNKTSFPLSNISNHQLKHIKNIINHNGICFLIISMNSSFYLLDGKTLIEFINHEKRKSIPYKIIKNSGLLINKNNHIIIDYLNIT